MKINTAIKLIIIVIATWTKAAVGQQIDIKPLIYINSYPIKSEDGCDYFTENLDSLKKGSICLSYLLMK
jgi:hypothetical protein